MDMRQLTDSERAVTEKKLAEMKDRVQTLNGYIADMEKELQDGVWCSDPEESITAWRQIEHEVARWKEESEQREVEHYGRLLTDSERSGFVRMPVKEENIAGID